MVFCPRQRLRGLARPNLQKRRAENFEKFKIDSGIPTLGAKAFR